MRKVIVHYHIFKNAGSTIDHILENNFRDSWAAFDGKMAHAKILPQELAGIIHNHPRLKAISSHNAILPVPEMPDLVLLPIFFLRHPIDRVRSIYDFERKQGQTAGPVSKGAEHAAKLSFQDYILWRFDSSSNGVTHNHQTAWLLHHPRFNRFEIQHRDYDNALDLLKRLPYFGIVESFDDSLRLLSDYLARHEIRLETDYQIKNSSKHREKLLEERLEVLRSSIGESTWAKIESRNLWDLKLYEAAQAIFQERLNTYAANSRGLQTCL